MTSEVGQERPTFLRAGEDDVFAVLTEPAGAVRRIGVVLLSGGVRAGTAGRNRVWWHLAGELAGDGYHVLRVDYPGIGESTGERRAFRLVDPAVPTLLAAVSHLAAHGVDDVVVVGTCFGSRTALSCAGQLPGLRGALLFSPPVVDLEPYDPVVDLPAAAFARRALDRGVLRRARDPRQLARYVRVVVTRIRRDLARRFGDRARLAERELASPAFLEPFTALAGRGVPVLVVFGDEDDQWQRFEAARAGALGRVLAGAGPHVAVETVPGHFHNLASLEAQQALVGTVVRWLDELEAARS